MATPQASVLIITSLFEPNVNRVIRDLDELGIRWFRLNTECFPLLCRGRLHLSEQGGPHAEIDLEDSRLDSRAVTAVWYRRQSEPVLAEGLAERDREFTRLECLGFFNALYRCFGHCRWMNLWSAERQASDKMTQLAVARSVGLRTPCTLVSNDPRAVRAFSTALSGRVVFKPLVGLVTGRPPDYSAQLHQAFEGKFSFPPAYREETPGQEHRLVFTQMLTPDKLAELDAIAACPAIFQERIEKAVELRITIVAERIFAAAIHSQEHAETKVDFRRLALMPSSAVKHTVVELPDTIGDKLLTLMKKLGLVFGCVDMILTPEEDYVFLEVNASGQWGWIEQLTGMPITSALVEFLVNGN